MARGHLRIYLGASPGVGKTYAMLDEGWRRRQRGTDTVVAVVETHGRAQTAAQLRDLEVVPRRSIEHRGTVLQEMDVDAVLARRPALALVDELAHTNAPGSRNEKRWQDVDELLDAGIDVISTVNVQHLESLNDVVQRITGTTQNETVPDAFVRSADQVELVDMTPEAIRRRMAHGNIYPAERIDAALTNFFKLGNLAALREIALLWVADRVEDSVRRVLETEGVEGNWETRERVVVAIAGAPSGEALLRRAARIAGRVHGELIVVRVIRSDGLAGADTSRLVDTRRLVTELGGRYHEVVGDDVISALLTFARAERATQLVVGASPSGAWRPWHPRPFVSRLVARSGPLDVHVISVNDEPGTTDRVAKVAQRLSASTPARFWWGLGLAVLGPILLTALLVPMRASLNLSSAVLAFLVVAIATAVLGGHRPALLCTLNGFGLLNWYFTPPIGTLTVGEPANIVTLVLFVVVTVIVGTFVDRAATRGRDAARARAEAEALARSSAVFVESDNPLPTLVEHVRTTFGFASVGVRSLATGEMLLSSPPGTSTELPSGTSSGLGNSLPLGRSHGVPTHELVVRGAALTADQQRVLDVLADHVSVALESQETRAEAARVSMLEGVDTVRTALLRAVSHDLRTPLAAIKAFVSGLRQRDVRWTPAELTEMYEGIESETDRLDALVSNLLDASRLEAGVLAVQRSRVSIDEPVGQALRSVSGAGERVSIALPADVPTIETDPTLLERAIANLVSNAMRHGGTGEIRIDVANFATNVVVCVIDHGPGVAIHDRRAVLEPFQRLGDVTSSAGIGLGLAITDGIVRALGGRLELTETPGGGLTATIELPLEAGREA